MAPIISIIIPCYNHGQYIQEAISSIEKSAGKSPYEIIIIDDGSSDEYTINVLNSLEEKGLPHLKTGKSGIGKKQEIMEFS
ncbi:MAG: glycosyltransferase family 2 protein [Chitinophagaceae bacterium]|nr:glycosyltransferase family 2 protein [Chitinophagaceae bacterium]